MNMSGMLYDILVIAYKLWLTYFIQLKTGKHIIGINAQNLEEISYMIVQKLICICICAPMTLIRCHFSVYGYRNATPQPL